MVTTKREIKIWESADSYPLYLYNQFLPLVFALGAALRGLLWLYHWLGTTITRYTG
jgi:hypothetical protein